MPTLTGLEVEWVSLVDRAAARDAVQQSEPLRLLLFKREHNAHQEARMTPEETAAALKKAQDDATAATARAVTAEKAASDFKAMLDAKKKKDEEDAAAKSAAKKAEEINKEDLPPAVRAALEKAEADNAALAERVAKAETASAESDKIAKAERETRVTREFVAKAETFKALPIEAAKFGPVLKSASEKLTKDEYDALDTVLKAADAQIGASDLFKEQGRGGDAASKAGTAIAVATEKAAELRKSDPKLTEASALQQVFKADRALATRYQDELRAR